MKVITGEPRSGTSLLMSILYRNGVEIWGNENLKLRDQSKQAHHDSLNDEFWEVPHVTIRGINPAALQAQLASLPPATGHVVSKETGETEIKLDLPETATEFELAQATTYLYLQSLLDQLEQNKQSCVKIMYSGVIATSPSEIDRIVICNRNPRDICRSQLGLIGNCWLVPNATNYIINATAFLQYTQLNPDIPRLVIDYDHWFSKPKQTLSQLADFLDFKPDMESLTYIKEKTPTDDTYFYDGLFEAAEIVYDTIKTLSS